MIRISFILIDVSIILFSTYMVWDNPLRLIIAAPICWYILSYGRDPLFAWYSKNTERFINSGISQSEREEKLVKKTSNINLPLLISSLETEQGKRALESRLQKI